MNHQQNKPPRKKRQFPEQVESTAGKRPDGRQPAAAAERTDAAETAPARDEAASVSGQPLTNQDEQDRITNATTDDTPEV